MIQAISALRLSSAQPSAFNFYAPIDDLKLLVAVKEKVKVREDFPQDVKAGLEALKRPDGTEEIDYKPVILYGLREYNGRLVFSVEPMMENKNARAKSKSDHNAGKHGHGKSTNDYYSSPNPEDIERFYYVDNPEDIDKPEGTFKLTPFKLEDLRDKDGQPFKDEHGPRHALFRSPLKAEEKEDL